MKAEVLQSLQYWGLEAPTNERHSSRHHLG